MIGSWPGSHYLWPRRRLPVEGCQPGSRLSKFTPTPAPAHWLHAGDKPRSRVSTRPEATGPVRATSPRAPSAPRPSGRPGGPIEARPGRAACALKRSTPAACAVTHILDSQRFDTRLRPRGGAQAGPPPAALGGSSESRDADSDPEGPGPGTTRPARGSRPLSQPPFISPPRVSVPAPGTETRVAGTETRNADSEPPASAQSGTALLGSAAVSRDRRDRHRATARCGSSKWPLTAPPTGMAREKFSPTRALCEPAGSYLTESERDTR